MAANSINTQIILGVYRDKDAPFSATLGKCAYVPTVGKTFHSEGIKNIHSEVESSVTYGAFDYFKTESSTPDKVLVIQASGTILAQCNI
jgi:hypothetical protein